MATTNVNINNEIIPDIEEEKTPTVLENAEPNFSLMEETLAAAAAPAKEAPAKEAPAKEAPAIQDIPAPTDADIPAAPARSAEERAAWIKERDEKIASCKAEGKQLYVCSFTSGMAKKAIIVAKSGDNEPVLSKIAALEKEAGQVTNAIWALGMTIKWLSLKVAQGNFSIAAGDTLILGTNNNAAAIYVQKAYFSGKVSFSKSSSLSETDRQYVANVSKYIADSIRAIKEKYSCNVAVEALDRNTITSNGHASSDMFMLRECVVTFGDVAINGNIYQMATLPFNVNGEERSANFFTKFRPTYEDAKGVIRSYKAKNGKTPVEFYVESPYRATMWNLYNGIKEKINK